MTKGQKKSILRHGTLQLGSTQENTLSCIVKLSSKLSIVQNKSLCNKTEVINELDKWL